MNHSFRSRLLPLLRAARSLRWKWTLLAAAGALLVGWLALLPARRSEQATQPDTTQPTATSAPQPERKPALPQVSAQPSAADPTAHADLLHGLSSENSGDRIEALRALDDAGAVELLPRLLEFDLAADPEVAPTLITVATHLSARADPAQRTATAQRLAGWLQHELTRDSRDARGNTASLVDALGKIDSPEASRALSEALDAQRLPLHVETVAVQGLAHSADAERARPAVERFRQRMQEAHAADDFERELQAEAITAADRALAHWSG